MENYLIEIKNITKLYIMGSEELYDRASGESYESHDDEWSCARNSADRQPESAHSDSCGASGESGKAVSIR